MMFRPHLAAAAIEQRKTVTRRMMTDNPRSPWYRERCRYQPGDVAKVQPGRGAPSIGTVTIVAVYRELFIPVDISEAEARREGFRPRMNDFDGSTISARLDFLATWEQLHGSTADPVDVWVIRFTTAAPTELLAELQHVHIATAYREGDTTDDLVSVMGSVHAEVDRLLEPRP